MKLAHQCLSFDFSGAGQTSEPVLTLFTLQGPISLALGIYLSWPCIVIVQEEAPSDELEDDVATVQIPDTWRAHFEDPSFIQMFFKVKLR